MSFISPQGEQSTTTEITLLAALNSLATSPSGQFLRKTGAASFENATPSFSGSFLDLSDTPSSFSGSGEYFVRVNATATALVFSPTVISAGELPSNISATKIANGLVSNTEFQYLDGVTSNIQAQIDAISGIGGSTGSIDNALLRANGVGGSTVQGSSATATLSDNNDLTLYDATNDGNPIFAFGASDTERLTIIPTYDAGAQTLDYVEFATAVASATADKGEYRFNVDGTLVSTFDDGGLEIRASGSLSFGAVDILTDSAGTTTLNNIDALDATTEATIEAAMDTLPNVTSVGTLTTLTIDDITINGNTISSAGASTLAITPTAGQAITFDGTITLDAGVIAGATSITSTTFVGDLTGTASGNLTSGGALGTPSSGTLTNCTGLPVAGITASTTTALGVGSIELGHASDTTIARVSAGVVSIEGVNILTTAGGTLTGTINLGEGADPATIGLIVDNSLSADERYSGIVVAGTAGATLAFGDLCYLDVTATEWLLADADAAATAGDVVLGICVDASTDGAATSMLLIGTVRSAAFPASIALGAPVYVSTTAGDIQATQPSGVDDVIRVCGWAVTAEPNTIYFCPSSDFITHT